MRKYPKGTYNPRAPRPQSRGPRPNVWITGPDPEEHQKYRAFIQQKNQAQWRDEIWNITFEQWKDLWGEHWYNRGREKGCYCMTRKDREEAWTPDNTQVITREQHARIQSALSMSGYRSPARQREREKLGLPKEKLKPGRKNVK